MSSSFSRTGHWCVVLCLVAAAWSIATSAETIAIIGTGEVAGALGPEFAAQGHDIVYGSRDPERDSVRELVARTGGSASATTQADAVVGADIVVVAVPWYALEEVVANIGDLSGKIVIDPTNPRMVGDDGLRDYAVDPSNAEWIQRWAPQSRVVKAFNTMGWETMVDPDSTGGTGHRSHRGRRPRGKGRGVRADRRHGAGASRPGARALRARRRRYVHRLGKCPGARQPVPLPFSADTGRGANQLG